MDENKTGMQKKQNIVRRNIPIIAAFLIPIAVMVVIFAARNIYPFGDEMYLRSDMYHQYATFLKEFQSILKNGDSLLYTWNIGLGTDFIGTYAYYLASPVNWLVYFLPADNIPEIMAGFIILKSGLMSATMAFYLKKHFGECTFAVTAFGMFYGLSSYMAAYSWNLMWLDCLVLLPLIILGLERLVKEKKVSLYTISLAVCVISNYYISIMICIFAVIYFIYLLICDRSGAKVFRSICRFACYSLLAGAMACAVLLPMVYSMLQSASNSFDFPTTVRWYFNFFEMVSHAAMNVEPTVLSGYIPNIYCTIGVFMLIPLFWMCKKAKLRQRIGKTVLMAFMLVSFMLNILNYIWHGFHYPNSLSARQSFIYIFLVLVMAYEAFINMREYSFWQIGLCYVLGAAALILLQYLYGDEESYPVSVTVISCIFLTLYFICAMMKKSEKIPRVAVSALLVAAAVCETCVNTNETGYSTTSRSAYFDDNDEIDGLLEAIDDDGFYRVEKTKRRTKNDGAWSNYMSASLFSSSALAAVSDFYEEMGLQSSMNSYSYYGHTPLITAILGVKYELSTETIDDSLMSLLASADDMYLYENEYALSLGFAVDCALAESEGEEYDNPFRAQNAFIENACGVSGLFSGFTTISGSAILMNVSESGRLYIYIEEAPESIYIAIERNGEIISEEEYSDLETPQITELCDVEEGDVVIISSLDSDTETIEVTGAVMDYDVLAEAMELLSDEEYDIDEFSDTYVSGKITVSDEGYMFTSIPAENGWKVYVDGEEVQYDTYEDAFIMVYLSEGDHVVTFKYVPQGLIYGIIISLTALLIFIICMLRRLAIYGTSKKRRKDGPSAEKPSETEEPLSVEDRIRLEFEELG